MKQTFRKDHTTNICNQKHNLMAPIYLSLYILSSVTIYIVWGRRIPALLSGDSMGLLNNSYKISALISNYLYISWGCDYSYMLINHYILIEYAWTAVTHFCNVVPSAIRRAFSYITIYCSIFHIYCWRIQISLYIRKLILYDINRNRPYGLLGNGNLYASFRDKCLPSAEGDDVFWELFSAMA